jgi:phage baseplate assembly protein W
MKRGVTMSVIKGWKFPVQVNETTGRIETVEDNENVKQSVRMILSTQKYERKVVPTFGTDLRSYMFEVVNPTFITTLKNAISSSLKKWEKHIADMEVTVKASTGPVSMVEANIDYITDVEPTQERVTKRIDNNDT